MKRVQSEECKVKSDPPTPSEGYGAARGRGQDARVTPRACRRCGCTDVAACVDARTAMPCSWVAKGLDLCSACLRADERELVDLAYQAGDDAVALHHLQRRVAATANALGRLMNRLLKADRANNNNKQPKG